MRTSNISRAKSRIAKPVRNVAPWQAVRYAASAVGLLLAWAAVSAQGPTEGQTFQAGVDLTVLDVTVLDRNRRPIRDLQVSDFVVKQGDRVVPIVSFALVVPPARSEPAPETAPAAERDVATNEVPRGRFVAILFDRTIPYGRAVQAAKRFALSVVDALGPEDVAAVISTGSLSPPQNFTSDKERLRQTIERMALGTSLSAGVVADLSYSADVSAECYCDVCSLDALTRVANALAEVHAQPKVAFFIGQNLKPLAFHEPDYLRHICAPERIAAFTEMTVATERTKLFVHTVDPTGLEPPGRFSAARRSNGQLGFGSQHIENNPQTLLLLADVTGGRAIRNSNDPSSRTEELLAETDAFYLLGIGVDPRTRWTSRLEVSVARPGAEVRTRGTMPEAIASRAGAPGVQNAGTWPVGSVLPSRYLPMAMQLVPIAPAADGRSIRVTALLHIDTLRGPPAATSAESATVRVVALDTEGKEQAATETRIGPGGMVDGARDVVSTFNVRPGRYEVRAFVKNSAIAETASVFGHVDVPALGRERLSLSGPVLEVRPRLAPGEMSTSNTEWPQQRPTAHRTFASSATDLIAAVRIHQRVGEARPASLVVDLLDARGQVVSTERRTLSAERFGSQARIDEQFSVALDKLEAGDYTWHVRVQAGNLQQERAARFRVSI